MASIQVESKVFQSLKQAYSEKFGGSPSSLINRLNSIYYHSEDKNDNLIADRTIRSFFNAATPPKMQEKNLNYLCRVLLDQNSYQEALRKISNIDSDVEGDWLEPYWKHLERKCSTMRVLDMNEPIPIDSIYVNTFKILKNIQGRRQQTLEYLLNSLEIESATEQNFRRLFFSSNEVSMPSLEAAIRYKKLMILGKPGAGKTTFLKYLALHFSLEESLEKVVPVFIRFRDISENQSNKSLTETVIYEFTKYIPDSEKKVRNLLETGRALILLDGLDEVKVENNNIYRQIDDFTNSFPDNRFIITCRNAACDYVFDDFTEVEIADFEKEEIKMFVHQWFQIRGEEEISDRFLDKLEENQAVKELATSPLLLTILCLTFEDTYDFSINRYALYADAVDSLLRRWDTSRRIERKPDLYLSRQRKINMFSEIAYHGFTDNPPKFLWHQWELEKQIVQFLQNIIAEIDSREALRIIEANYGLLIQQSKGIYSFSHLTFQEFFAAEYIVENREPEFLKKFVEQNLIVRQWREVFILITERLSNADEFIKLMFKCTHDIVKDSQGLQDMLNWLHRMTTKAQIDSSSWRAYYLAIDLDVDLYISRDIEIDRTTFAKFATEIRKYNDNHSQLLASKPRALLISRLAAIHALAVDRSHGDMPNENQYVSLKTSNEFTIERLQIGNDTEVDINQKLDFAIQKAQESNLTDLARELIDLQNRHPLSHAANQEWEKWAEELRQLMLKHLDAGYKVNLASADVKALEHYIYANYLLFDCVSRGIYCSRELREEILDNLLLPTDEILPHLLSGYDVNNTSLKE
ncbi:MAG: NACHT domain-containing protein [Nostoc sp. NMS1]|uniref:NACHT domain-containing protein n=1 Tax=unclassified Nostoc TaxID=2593658 RepID=UPI0025FE68D3|nr:MULTISPECIES: NACHT domain-containing protein [unclassified Nostoc]MBN3908812.1 NACHT domain-containing protein [Nostoc sp. NMS1]MBN3992326.1 NACHT domain-containing protein [Nostoc sp. NMS2]